jgi:hypothetical protein
MATRPRLMTGMDRNCDTVFQMYPAPLGSPLLQTSSFLRCDHRTRRLLDAHSSLAQSGETSPNQISRVQHPPLQIVTKVPPAGLTSVAKAEETPVEALVGGDNERSGALGAGRAWWGWTSRRVFHCKIERESYPKLLPNSSALPLAMSSQFTSASHTAVWLCGLFTSVSSRARTTQPY